MRLSVSMIVKNEESCLAEALQSVTGADELVVVDTGSTDKTKEIAASFGARLYDFPWCDDFAKARNFSLSKCTGTHVFIIDADETLVSSMEQVRETIAANPDAKAIGFTCRSAKGSENHTSPRVFKRCPEIFWQGAIHNHLNISASDTVPSGLVMEYGYSEAHKADPDRTLRILTKVLTESPSAVRESYYLAREYWYRKDYTTAIRWYEDYLKKATWAPEMADAWLMLARCLWHSQRGEEARDCCLQAIKINADFKEAFLLMAEMSWPKNKERWKVIAETATNQDVLFVRT